MVDSKFKAVKAKLRLLAKALIPRLLFILHGLLCTDFIVWSERENKYSWLLICLGLIVVEGIVNVLVRDGKEFHWFCPSAFFYCIVLIIPLTALRVTQMNNCLGKGALREFNKTDITDHFTTEYFFIEKTFKERISFVEQTGMAVLIIGRWALPKGSISKEQFLQIVLIYIGTAADILELSEIYDEDIASMTPKKVLGVYYGTISVWALSISQFAMTIALPEKGLKDLGDEDDDPRRRGGGPTSLIRTKFPNKVAPMSYMHYKSILREKTENSPNNAFRPLRNGGFQENAPKKTNMLKVASQNVFTMRVDESRSSLSLPSINNENETNGVIKKETEEIVPKKKRSQSEVPSLDFIKSYPPITDAIKQRTLSKKTSQLSEQSQDSIKSPPPIIEEVIDESPLKKRKSHESLESNKSHSPMFEAQGIKLIKKPPSSESTRARANISRKSLKSNSPISLLTNPRRNSSTIGTRNIWKDTLNQYTNSKQKTNRRVRNDSETENNDLGIGKQKLASCFEKYFDMIEMLHPVVMQDGPFFILRIVLLYHFGVSTDMTYLLIGKNFLVIVVSIYRMLLMYCAEPKLGECEHDEEEASNRLRVAMDSNRRLSDKHAFNSRQEYLSMYVLNTLQSESNQSRVRNLSPLTRTQLS